ncbi:hypothetical protein F4818DRAFT_451453 [Hypoxylon cercidicola]|nr:hypothetical protein F4818DRAFT_451453 [Hypoxylon cercidicola]
MKDEEENLLDTPDVSITTIKRDSGFLRILLAISVLFNVILILFGVFSYNREQEPVGQSSYENGFASDLDYIKGEIELVDKTFTGGVSFDSEGNLVTDQGGHEYIGHPSTAVDDAWETLLEGLNLDFSKDEADLTGTTFQWPETGLYFSGLDVYHSLHCLNRLRQAIYPEYYTSVFDKPTDPSRVDHIGHCINHIRQALQCHADLTPMEWNLDGSRIILKTDTRHTCRNFEKIHVWATSHRTKFENIKTWLNGSLTIVD